MTLPRLGVTNPRLDLPITDQPDIYIWIPRLGWEPYPEGDKYLLRGLNWRILIVGGAASGRYFWTSDWSDHQNVFIQMPTVSAGSFFPDADGVSRKQRFFIPVIGRTSLITDTENLGFVSNCYSNKKVFVFSRLINVTINNRTSKTLFTLVILWIQSLIAILIKKLLYSPD